MNQDKVSTSLEQLFQRRPHGAISLAGFQFQLLYSLNRFLDLASDENQITRIRLEGIDDVDVWHENSRTFIQVKSSKNKQGWNWLNKERILDRFAEVYRLDTRARFQIVTNVEFTGALKALYDFATEGEISLPAAVAGRLAPIGKRLNLSRWRWKTS